MNCEFCLSYIKQPVDSFLFHCIDLSEQLIWLLTQAMETENK